MQDRTIQYGKYNTIKGNNMHHTEYHTSHKITYNINATLYTQNYNNKNKNKIKNTQRFINVDLRYGTLLGV
jgi:hypothetical protein